MLQLPNVDETKDPIIKKLILAVQTLSDELGSQNTVIYGEMVGQLKGLRKDIKDGFQNQNEVLTGAINKQNEVLTDSINNQNQVLTDSLNKQTDILKIIAENTKK